MKVPKPGWLSDLRNLTISREKPADGTATAWTGEVLDIGYLGNLSVYHVKLDSGKMVASTQTNQTRLVERSISLGRSGLSDLGASDASIVLAN